MQTINNEGIKQPSGKYTYIQRKTAKKRNCSWTRDAVTGSWFLQTQFWRRQALYWWLITSTGEVATFVAGMTRTDQDVGVREWGCIHTYTLPESSASVDCEWSDVIGWQNELRVARVATGPTPPSKVEKWSPFWVDSGSYVSIIRQQLLHPPLGYFSAVCLFFPGQDDIINLNVLLSCVASTHTCECIQRERDMLVFTVQLHQQDVLLT